MDMEKLILKHPNVSREEMEEMQKTANEKTNGRESITAGPLVQLLSVHFLPSHVNNNTLIDQNKPFTIYGRIYAEYRDTTSGKMIVNDLFSRKCDDAQVLRPSGGPLALIGPDFPRWPFEGPMSMNNTTKLVVDVFVGDECEKMFADKKLCCADEDLTIDLEKVKLEYVHGEVGSLALHYVAMPFGVYGHVEVLFFHKKLDEENLHRSIDVKGKIVARHGSNPSGSECTIFEKLCENEFERVENDSRRGEASMRLSRCWVGVPAYSSLILDVDLTEFGTNREILKKTVELRVGNSSFVRYAVDDCILICVRVGWASSEPLGPQQELCGMELDDESLDDEMSSDDDEQMDEALCVPLASSSNLSPRPWVLRAHQERPMSTSFVEIFSVFVGRENLKPLQVYGSIDVGSEDCKFFVFKREAKEDAFNLLEHSKTIPVQDSPRLYDDCGSLEMKIDLKDVESRLHIKGFVDWDWRQINIGSSKADKQLCSVIQGKKHGDFAAVHYTIFSRAEHAYVELLCIPKKNGGGADDHDYYYPPIHGSLIAQYNNYDYNSRYNKDYYRIVLFKRNRMDPAMPDGGLIPLSRSMVVVPHHSSLVFESNIGYGFSDEEVPTKKIELEIGAYETIDNILIMEGNDFSIHINVRWGVKVIFNKSNWIDQDSDSD